jgi:uncharacterized BrkB/YihY/UPF0761 family membrane protein
MRVDPMLMEVPGWIYWTLALLVTPAMTVFASLFAYLSPVDVKRRIRSATFLSGLMPMSVVVLFGKELTYAQTFFVAGCIAACVIVFSAAGVKRS